MHRIRLRALALPAAFAALASCSGDLRSPAEPELRRATSLGPTLIECPVEVTRTVTGRIGATGGALELDGHRLNVPALAVDRPTDFTLTIPAGNYMEVDVSAPHGHYNFRRPVSLTVSYARCTRSNIEGEALRVFYVDPATKQILQDLGGVDDKDARTVTTSTDHLSGYAIGGI